MAEDTAVRAQEEAAIERKLNWAHTTKVYTEHLWDHGKLCANPHKGWYMHYYDNSIHRYWNTIEPGDYLEDFPGMDHLYLRLAWSYLEPEEGKFDWEIIDRVIREWTPRGYGISFRISCMEAGVDQPFATPRWVMEAGAKGEFIVPCYSSEHKEGQLNWEPDYGDPVFLEKLEQFHRVFAARYAAEPWFRYIDIGSYGVWGEGHTICSSQRDWPAEVIKKHIDLHRQVYPDALVVVSDELINMRIYTTEDHEDTADELQRYVLDNKLGLRDDTISVPGIQRETSFHHLRSAELYEYFWRDTPVNLELHHYEDALARGGWEDGVPLTGALRESHATYLGFHGSPGDFLKDNPKLAVDLANRAGYWYFIKSVEHSRRLGPDGELKLRLVWENHGAAPSYRSFGLTVKVELLDEGAGACGPAGGGGRTYHREHVPMSGNLNWLPGGIKDETYRLRLPEAFRGRTCSLKVRLLDEGGHEPVLIELGLTDRVRDEEGFYQVTVMEFIGG
ncbi:beta-galactosidase [Paenibacillus gansuensis]|uniref:Beta-galactosidase n=1 Tax=Paenibacillus gansuensis TaxID=306542 RepID=A0ABW5PHT2_9BACL